MEKLITIVSELGVATFLIVIWLCIIAIKEMYDVCAWFRGKLEAWHNKKNGIEKREESTEDRLGRLESKQETIEGKLDKMYDLIVGLQKDTDEVTVANSRATLNTLAEQIKAKGYMTQTEYETFVELSEIYLRKNGNHTMKDKIIPYIKSLPVKDI